MSSVSQVANPACRRIFTALRILGTLLMTASLISDYSYVIKQKFSSKLYLILYLVILLIRILIPIFLLIRYFCVKVFGQKNVLNEVELERVDKFESQKGKQIAI